MDPRGEDACYTDWKTGQEKCHKSSDTYCPSGNCSTYGEGFNNSKYAQCMNECEETFKASMMCAALGGALKVAGAPKPVASCVGKVCTMVAQASNRAAGCLAKGRE